MIAIGADAHKRMCAVATQNEDGQLKMLPSMKNHARELAGAQAVGGGTGPRCRRPCFRSRPFQKPSLRTAPPTTVG